MMERLSDFPWVVVRVGCNLCRRKGEYRLARLAAKYGPEISLTICSTGSRMIVRGDGILRTDKLESMT
jgi:hypothetical protein